MDIVPADVRGGGDLSEPISHAIPPASAKLNDDTRHGSGGDHGSTNTKSAVETIESEAKSEIDDDPAASSNPSLGHRQQQRQQPAFARDSRFWSAYAGLFIIAMAGSIDALIITTSLPTILRDLGGGQEAYTWTANCYAIAQTAVQPLFGQLADVIGRRHVMLTAVLLFMLGSGLGGGANNLAMLLAGRTIQGFGAGGIIMLLDLITCDLIPLRQRPMYLGLVLAACALGTCLGPVVGGAITTGLSWRWTFYFNLPIAGAAFVVLFLFLRLNRRPSLSWRATLAKIDIFGNVLFIASIVSLQIGLVLGGSMFPWGSYHVVVPVVLGAAGWASFHVYQSSSLCSAPIMPPRLFTNRTSLVGFFLVFQSSLLMQWASYFLPLYFQTVRESSPLVSGVNVLPVQAFMIPSAGVAGGLITRFGRYKPIHLGGFVLITVGCGLLSLLDGSTGKIQWVFSEIVTAVGLGAMLTSCLPSIQASLSDADAASSTATYAFVRSFGFVWSVTIPSIIFSHSFDEAAGAITDADVRSMLSSNGAELQVGPETLQRLTETTRGQVLGVFTHAFRTTWYAAVAFAAVGVLCVLFEKQLELRTTLQTDFALTEKEETEENCEIKGA